MKNKKALLVIGVLIVIVVASVLVYNNYRGEEKEDVIKIGAILPLTGSASIWGESIQEGMEMALEEINQKNKGIIIFYEDSQANPSQGISAYRKLIDVNNVDIILSVFSGVTEPLINLVDEDKIPLIMTLVSSRGIADKSPYAIRFNVRAEQNAEIPFHPSMQISNYKKIALLYIKDEFGESVNNLIRTKAINENLNIVADESFLSEEMDFKTQLMKIKNEGTDIILFTAPAPIYLINFIKQKEELSVSGDVVDIAFLSSLDSTIEALGEKSEGIFTPALPFTLEVTGNEFRELYQSKYQKKPIYTTALGYDIIKLIDQSSADKDKLISLGVFDSLNGELIIHPNGEINPPLYPARIKNKMLKILP